MSQAEELLDSISIDDIELYTADPETEEHIVVGLDRFITVPDSLKRIGVQYDHNIETVTFDCPRYWDGIDMSTMKIYINYRLSNNNAGMYLAKNVMVDSANNNIIHFDWTISRNVTEVRGNISFLVCIKKVNDEGIEVNHWNSEISESMYISPGFECDDSITDKYPDVITYILERLDSLGGTNAGKMINMFYGSKDNNAITGITELTETTGE